MQGGVRFQLCKSGTQVLVFSHRTARDWLAGVLFAERYARNNIIVWRTRDFWRFFAALLAAAGCRRGMLGPNSEKVIDGCRVSESIVGSERLGRWLWLGRRGDEVDHASRTLG